MSDSVIITAVDNSTVCIENFKSIVHFEDDELKINTRRGPVRINGKNLTICYYDDEEILIKGCISSILLAEGHTE